MRTRAVFTAALSGLMASYATCTTNIFPTLLASGNGVRHCLSSADGLGTASKCGAGTGTGIESTLGRLSSSSVDQETMSSAGNLSRTLGTGKGTGISSGSGTAVSSKIPGSDDRTVIGTGSTAETAPRSGPSGQIHSSLTLGPHSWSNHTRTPPLSPGAPATRASNSVPMTSGGFSFPSGTGLAYFSLGPSNIASRKGSDLILGTRTLSPGGPAVTTNSETISIGLSGQPFVDGATTSSLVPLVYGSCYGVDCVGGGCKGPFCHSCFGLDCHDGSCSGPRCTTCIGLGCHRGKCSGPLCFAGGKTSCFGADCGGSEGCTGPDCQSCSGPDCGASGSCTGPQCIECSGVYCNNGICKGSGCTQKGCQGLSKRGGACSLSISSEVSYESCSTTEVDHCTVPCSYTYTSTGSSLSTISTCLSRSCRTITGCSVQPYTTTTFIGSFSTSSITGCPIRFTPYNFAASASQLGIALPPVYHADPAGPPETEAGTDGGTSSILGTGTGFATNSINSTSSSTSSIGLVPAITSLPAMSSCSLVRYHNSFQFHIGLLLIKISQLLFDHKL